MRRIEHRRYYGAFDRLERSGTERTVTPGPGEVGMPHGQSGSLAATVGTTQRIGASDREETDDETEDGPATHFRAV